MENKNGQGIFYGVIGVATLVVAIIGATFAYFSATVSNNTVVAGSTGSGANLQLDVVKVTGTEGNLIPLTSSMLGDALGSTKGAVCKDSNNNNVCNLYKITITNNGASAIRVKGTMTLNTGSENTIWQLVQTTGTGASIAYSPLGSTSYGVTESGEIVANESLTSGNGTHDYYAVVWLNETNHQQDDATETGENTKEDSTAYSGTVKFEAVTVDGTPAGGLTATFTS